MTPKPALALLSGAILFGFTQAIAQGIDPKGNAPVIPGTQQQSQQSSQPAATLPYGNFQQNPQPVMSGSELNPDQNLRSLIEQRRIESKEIAPPSDIFKKFGSGGVVAPTNANRPTLNSVKMPGINLGGTGRPDYPGDAAAWCNDTTVRLRSAARRGHIYALEGDYAGASEQYLLGINNALIAAEQTNSEGTLTHRLLRRTLSIAGNLNAANEGRLERTSDPMARLAIVQDNRILLYEFLSKAYDLIYETALRFDIPSYIPMIMDPENRYMNLSAGDEVMALETQLTQYAIAQAQWLHKEYTYQNDRRRFRIDDRMYIILALQFAYGISEDLKNSLRNTEYVCQTNSLDVLVQQLMAHVSGSSAPFRGKDRDASIEADMIFSELNAESIRCTRNKKPHGPKK